MKKDQTKVKVYGLSFGGDMKKQTITVDEFPKDILKVDDWFAPRIGELCFVDGKMDIVKDINSGQYGNMYRFEISDSETCTSSINRIEVKKGKVFIFKGKVFTHQEPLDGGYIDKMARGNNITEYEYEFGE